MQKNLIMASRGYGKTYKSLQHFKQAGCQRIAVCCGESKQYDWIQSKISQDIYPDIDFIKTRNSLTLKDTCSYDFFSSLSVNDIRGREKYDGLFLYSIESWNSNELRGWLDFYDNALYVLDDNSIIVATSLERKSDILTYLLLSGEYFLDTPGTRLDNCILFPVSNPRDMSLNELRNMCILN